MVPCAWSLTGAHLELVHMQRLPRLRSSGEWDHTPYIHVVRRTDDTATDRQTP